MELRLQKVPFERLLYAIGIRHVGETTAKNCKKVKNLNTLLNLTELELEKLMKLEK